MALISLLKNVLKHSWVGQIPAASPHLEAGALQHQVSRLDQVQGELQVEVGAFAQSLQVTDELGQRRVVQATIAQRHVALNLSAAVDPLHQVALRKGRTEVCRCPVLCRSRMCARACYLQILIYGIVLLNLVEGNAVEW